MGKTVYLTVLSHQVLSQLRRRFDADVRLLNSSHSNISNADRLIRYQEMLAMTQPSWDGRREPIVIEWRTTHRAGVGRHFRSSYLSLYDTAGEDLRSEAEAYNLRYLAAADAIVLFIDPLMLPQARDQVMIPQAAIHSDAPALNALGSLVDALRMNDGVRPKNRIKTPVAVVLTKMDLYFDVLGADHPLMRQPVEGQFYDEAAGERTHEQVRSLLHNWGADDIDAHLQHNFEIVRYFAVSSLGAAPDYAAGKIDPEGIRPFRADEPITWLLSHFGIVAKSRH